MHLEKKKELTFYIIIAYLFIVKFNFNKNNKHFFTFFHKIITKDHKKDLGGHLNFLYLTCHILQKIISRIRLSNSLKAY